MKPPTPQQLAAVLQRAAHARRDVRRARVTVAPDNPRLLLVDVHHATEGRRVQREASAFRLLDGRTCGQILDQWLGAMPGGGSLDEPPAIRHDRNRQLERTPAQAVAAAKIERAHKPAAAAPPQSQLNWPNQPADLEGAVPAIPEHAESAAERMTRQQMLDAGMDQQARHEQYRRQGGKHPDDAAT